VSQMVSFICYNFHFWKSLLFPFPVRHSRRPFRRWALYPKKMYMCALLFLYWLSLVSPQYYAHHHGTKWAQNMIIPVCVMSLFFIALLLCCNAVSTFKELVSFFILSFLLTWVVLYCGSGLNQCGKWWASRAAMFFSVGQTFRYYSVTHVWNGGWAET
jgi:hypothetical protein